MRVLRRDEGEEGLHTLSRDFGQGGKKCSGSTENVHIFLFRMIRRKRKWISLFSYSIRDFGVSPKPEMLSRCSAGQEMKERIITTDYFKQPF